MKPIIYRNTNCASLIAGIIHRYHIRHNTQARSRVRSRGQPGSSCQSVMPLTTGHGAQRSLLRDEITSKRLRAYAAQINYPFLLGFIEQKRIFSITTAGRWYLLTAIILFRPEHRSPP